MAIVLAPASGAAPSQVDVEPPVQRSLILNAFGDAEGTYGESLPFLEVLMEKVDRSGESAYCRVVVEGQISGQPVAVIVSGTGGGNSGPCMQEMLGWYSPSIKEVIWSGIGGATPAIGGMYDEAGARLGNPAVMIGDVCVGTSSWSWDLHFSNVNDWAASRNPPSDVYRPSGGWWPMVSSQGKEVVPGFDDIQQLVVADPALADEVLAAAGSVRPRDTQPPGDRPLAQPITTMQDPDLGPVLQRNHPPMLLGWPTFRLPLPAYFSMIVDSTEPGSQWWCFEQQATTTRSRCGPVGNPSWARMASP